MSLNPVSKPPVENFIQIKWFRMFVSLLVCRVQMLLLQVQWDQELMNNQCRFLKVQAQS